jgi:hypothetical protein
MTRRYRDLTEPLRFGGGGCIAARYSSPGDIGR